jgi:hypothetical protein
MAVASGNDQGGATVAVDDFRDSGGQKGRWKFWRCYSFDPKASLGKYHMD